MIFSTNVFVFLFLPALLAIYYATPWRFKSFVLLAASYAFYGWWRVDYLILVFSMSVFSYYAAYLAICLKTETLRRRAMLVGVFGDLAVLAYFKYLNFFVGNVNGILTFVDSKTLTWEMILLPIGISFHTFQSISYVIDVWRRDVPPSKRLIDFLAFGALFPQLIAGPVLRYKDLSEQFVSRVHSAEKFTRGMYRFIQGLAMKVLVADAIAPLADRMFELQAPTLIESWLGALAYSFQLFFDFAGYSAMAIGLGLMLGFTFIENFNRPYLSRSITEFWKRWHISLSAWLRDYLYVPLGGNRKGRGRTYFNLIFTMVLGGFWHGSNWTFILWGLWHGGIMAIERAMGSKDRVTVWPTLIAMPMTFLIVLLGWVMFRAESVHAAFSFYGGMVGLNGIWISPDVVWQIRSPELAFLTVAATLSFYPLINWSPIRWSPRSVALGYTALGTLAVSRMAAQTHSPFLYFQF